MTYSTEAHNRLLARLAQCHPGEISTHPTADEFVARRTHIEQVTSLVDEYFHSLAIDAASNSHEIKPRDFLGVVSNAVHDASLLAQFTSAAYETEEQGEANRADHFIHLAREVA